jgi:hypothetical protein
MSLEKPVDTNSHPLDSPTDRQMRNALKTVYSSNGYHVIELDSSEGVWDFVELLHEND